MSTLRFMVESGRARTAAFPSRVFRRAMRSGALFDWSLHYGASVLPLDMCSDAGARTARWFGATLRPGQHANAASVLRALRSDLRADPHALASALDRLWDNIGRSMAEFAIGHRLLEAGRVDMRGREALQAILDTRRPIIMVFPHLGNWELSEMQIGFMAPHRGAVIVAPPNRAARAVIAMRIRGQAPAELLPMSRTVWRRALERLRTPGGGLMMSIDEQINGDVHAPTFGSSPPPRDGNIEKAARLALTTGALIIPFYNERLSGARFVTHILPAIEVSGDSRHMPDVLAIIEKIQDALRPPIVRLVDQWYMAQFAKSSFQDSH